MSLVRITPSSLSFGIFFYFYLLKGPFNTIYLQLQIVIESNVVRQMNLFLSFVNLCMQQFLDSVRVCVVSQKRRLELEDNKDRL
jgi:hypothetical protein